MTTRNQVIARAGQLRAALQAMLDAGLSGAKREIVEGLLTALISRVEVFGNSNEGGASQGYSNIINRIDAALAVARPTSIPALEVACERVFDALGA